MVSALANISARIFLSEFLSFSVAVIIAYFIGMSCAYFLNRKFVFVGGVTASSAEFLRFAAVNVAALAQVWLVSVALAEYIFPALNFRWHSETIAHTIGVGSPIITSFFAYKLFVFRVNGIAHRQ